ncbi:MAG: phosphoglycerate kinase [Conexivisphaerales archaeon]
MVSYYTLDDVETEDKLVLMRSDLNTPVDKSGNLIEKVRLEEAAVSLRDLSDAMTVIISHQGRVGRPDFIELEKHAAILGQLLNREVKYVDDIIGPKAIGEIKNLKRGEILLLDNLRLLAEENLELSMEEAANTIFVKKLYSMFDLFVLDAFPTAHRSHPSIVGFPYYIPAIAGRLIVRELKGLTRITQFEKGPYTTVLGGTKVGDRIEAMTALIKNGKADKVLSTGRLGLLFLIAAGKLSQQLSDEEARYLAAARYLLDEYPSVIEMPHDLAYMDADGQRKEAEVKSVPKGVKVLDIGEKTIKRYSRIIKGSGTVFMSGPPSAFEVKGFELGTEELLLSVAKSSATSIVSGGHLSTAMQRLKISNWIDHVSTAGGALIQYLSGKPLPLFEALEYSASRIKENQYQEKVIWRQQEI